MVAKHRKILLIAGVVQWQNGSFPSCIRGFDSLHPLHLIHLNKMSRVVKFVVLPLAGGGAVLAAIVVYVVATFDPNAYKPQIVQALKDRTQRTLKLEGDIKLSFFPDIGARLGRASLSEHASEGEFAFADDFHVALKLLPLLSREVVVDTIEATNLRAHLIRYKNGKTNIDDLTATGAQPAPASDAGQVKVEIRHITLRNATITYTDQGEGTHYALSQMNLKTGRIASGVPSKIELSANLQSAKPPLNLDTTFATTLTFELDTQRVSLKNMDLTAKGMAAGLNNLAATAKGDVEAHPATRELRIAKLAIAAGGKHEGGDFNVKGEVPTLVVTRDKVSGEKVALDMNLAFAKGKLAARLDIPGIEGNAQAFRAGQLNASIDVQQDGSAIKAKLTSPLAGSIDAQRAELSKLVASLSINNPKTLKNPLAATITGAGHIDVAKQSANFTFATKVDDSNVSGRAGLAKFAPPFYTFDITIDQLDADRYLPKPDPKKPDQPFDLAVLKGLNASGSLRIGVLNLANVKATNVRFDLKKADSRVDVKPLAAQPYQGSLSGALSVQASAVPLIAVKQGLLGR